MQPIYQLELMSENHGRHVGMDIWTSHFWTAFKGQKKQVRFAGQLHLHMPSSIGAMLKATKLFGLAH